MADAASLNLAGRKPVSVQGRPLAPEHGRMAERLKAPVLKTGMDGMSRHRGFESYFFRQCNFTSAPDGSCSSSGRRRAAEVRCRGVATNREGQHARSRGADRGPERRVAKCRYKFRLSAVKLNGSGRCNRKNNRRVGKRKSAAFIPRRPRVQITPLQPARPASTPSGCRSGPPRGSGIPSLARSCLLPAGVSASFAGRP